MKQQIVISTIRVENASYKNFCKKLYETHRS